MSRKHIKWIFFSFFIINLFSLIQNAQAHSPSISDIKYDVGLNALTVKIYHNVGNPNTHYIGSVEIKVNGNVEFSKTYTSQPTINEFSYEYTINANTGDTIEVYAACNLAGSDTQTLIAGSTFSPSNTFFDLILKLFSYPHFIFMLAGIIFFTLSILCVILHKPKKWFIYHKRFALIGGILIIIGLIVLFGLNLLILHGIIGLIAFIFLLSSILTGYLVIKKKKRKIRKPHIWIGRIIFIAAVVAVFMGIITYL
jgi:hypothetical protein